MLPSSQSSTAATRPPCLALVSKRQEPNSGDTQRKNEQHVKIQHLNPSDRYFLVTTYNSIGSLIFMLMIYIPLCLHLCIPEIGLVHISVEYSTQIHRMQEWWKVQNFLTLECESDAFSILVEFWIYLLSWKIWINLNSKCIGGTAHLCQKHMQKWFNLWSITFLFSGLANASCQIWTFLWITNRKLWGRIETLAMKTCFKLVMMSIVTPARALAGELLL